MKVSVLGCGSFGLALAHLLSRKMVVHAWEHSKERVTLLHNTGKSDLLPYKLQKNIIVHNDIVNTVKDADVIFIAIPSQFVVSTIMAVKRHFKKDTLLVIGSKGLDTETHTFIIETLEKKINQKIFVLSGPMFAVDLIKDTPAAGVLAGRDKRKAEIITSLFHNTPLTLSVSSDVIGVSLCGAVKNVYAIGSGMIKGLGYENSTNAFYLTKCLQEMEHLLFALKANRETLLSPAGIGDLILTANSSKSRNFTFGEVIGKGIAPKNIEFTIEGRQTLLVLFRLLQARRIEAPIVSMLYDIIFKNKAPHNLVTLLK